MKEFKATTTIAAPAARIWEILTNAPAYPEWDPYCVKLEGKIALGEKLKAFTKLSPGRAFPLKVTELTSERMTWQGGMPFGLFKGVRSFTLVPTTDGAIQFTMHEVFSGPMLALIGGTIPDMTDAFEQFAQALKARAEGTQAQAKVA
jgi:hypothetical protein